MRAQTGLENTLTRELGEVGFAVGEEPSAITLDIEVKKLTTGSRAKRLLSVYLGNPVMQYAMTVYGPDAEILGRADWEQEFKRTMSGKENPDVMSDTAILDWLIERGTAEIVGYAAVKGRYLDETPAVWSDLHRVELVVNDQVGTEYSSTGTAELEDELAEDLRGAGYELGEGSDALTLEVDIVEYEPGSFAKRLISVEAGGPSLVYQATLRDASGEIVGTKRGEKRFIGTDFVNKPALKSNKRLRKDMVDYCADEITDYVRNLQLRPLTGPRAGSLP